MAFRNQVDVNERRLRPIYENLDSGFNKKAIQEVDKLLKKNKNFLCAKALKALALLRLGKQDESEALLKEIHTQSPSEENVLHAMSICYKETYQWQQIADMYQVAHKGNPENEDILSALFMSYVRLGDYKKQQQTAMLLHKLRPTKNPYYFWAVMSIVMQARNADEKLAKSMYLPLAERMVLVYVNGDKIDAEAEVQLYLSILEMQGKKEEMLTVVSGPLGKKLQSESNSQLKQQAQLNVNLEQWSEANIQYKSLLNYYADDWHHWQLYLTSTMTLISQKWQPPEKDSDVDNTTSKALTFIIDQIQKCSNRPLRAPHLAQMELCRLSLDLHNDTTQMEKPFDLLTTYFTTFGAKPTCCADLRPFLCLLTHSEKTQFIDTISGQVTTQEEDGSIRHMDNVKDMYRHICVLQLAQCCGYYDNVAMDDRLTISQDLFTRFIHGLPLGESLLATDIQYCDNYLLLSTQLLIDCFRLSHNTKYLWDAVAQLERGCVSSESNSQFMLILINIYSHLGVFGPCAELYSKMEIKHIVHDSLGYMLFNNAVRLGHISTASTLYSTMMSFYTVNQKEIPEHIILAYKYGSFHKANEFLVLRDRLYNSLQYSQVTIELLLLELIHETNSHKNTEQVAVHMDIDPTIDKVKWESLVDNRDLNVITHWQPSSVVNMEEIKEKSFTEEVCWLKIRTLTLRLLSASLRLPGLAHSCCSNGVSHDHDQIDRQPLDVTIGDLMSELGDHLTTCDGYAQPPDYTIYGPFRTRLHTYISANHSQVFTLSLQLVIYVHSLKDSPYKNVITTEEAKMQALVALLDEMVSSCQCDLITTTNNTLYINATLLEQYVQITETISHVVILAGVMHRILKPIKTSLSKQGKKKKAIDTVTLPVTIGNYTKMCSGLESCVKRLHQQVKSVDPVLLGMDLASLELEVRTSDSDQDVWKGVCKKVESSLQESSEQLAELLHNKLHYINGLKL